MQAIAHDRPGDRRVILSTLWIFAVLNYLYADVITLFFQPSLQPEVWEELQSGFVGSIEITQGFALAAAVLMETAIAMVLLSRILRYRANRWANIGAGLLHTAAVSWSLSEGSIDLFYAFFATVEIACTLFIVWYAWTWSPPENRPALAVADLGRRDGEFVPTGPASVGPPPSSV
jgi:Family of unknown function (DUF6326)